MKIHTFRARTMRDALDEVRNQLGPDAKVLHTRVKNRGLIARALFGQTVEVAASLAEAPSPAESRGVELEFNHRDRYRATISASAVDDRPALDDLLNSQRSEVDAVSHMPEELFQLFADLIEADVDEPVARDLLTAIHDHAEGGGSISLCEARDMVAASIADQIRVTGPICVGAPTPRVVALVGPTGVGKTTTIAKLAANFRLRENRRVGLITVDTYRVAAVEQLRTYADIIDLPMEVVSTPHEVREAVESMSDLDLVLMDTAGRSPKDAVRIHELRHLLTEANADEVQLVLSTTASSRSLQATCREFAAVGPTAVVLTKLDEATSLGHLVGVLAESKYPVSYLTDGQNVPDDIAVARSETLGGRLLGFSTDALVS